MAELISAYRGENERFRAEWPERGVAVTGDFAGIQRYVLKPVPGAKGAAKRLRGRSLTVVALTQLAAEETRRRMGGGARVFYQAGGRFLVVTGSPAADWEEGLAELRREMDAFFQEEFRGETIFHLAGVAFEGRRIPHEALSQELRRLRGRPMAAALMEEGGWREEVFWKKPGEQAFRCPACLGTADERVTQRDEDGEEICVGCDRDKRLGGKLAGLRQACLREAENGEIGFLGRRYMLGETGEPLDLVHHLPRVDGEVLSFEEIAAKAQGGRKYLGYLRLDADKVGEAFRETNGSPEKTLALSLFLQRFFCGRVQELVTQRYPWIYPVYGGGDDLFVIGPWDATLEFAFALREELRKLVEVVAADGTKKETVKFSAAVELAKPGQHILTKAEAAEEALAGRAKVGRDAIHALGETVEWSAFKGVLQRAKKVAGWRERKQVSAGFLRDLLRLHQEWRANPGRPRWRALLHYQVARNIDARKAEEAWQWAQGLLHEERGKKDWERAEFFVRYAMLAAGERGEE